MLEVSKTIMSNIKNTTDLIQQAIGKTISPDLVEKASSAAIYKGAEALMRFEYLQEKYEGGLTTGYQELDDYFTFLPQQLYLLSAPTHHGKTLLSLNMAARIATFGKKVLFISLEQGSFVAQFVKSIVEGEYPENLWIMETSDMLSVEELLSCLELYGDKPDIIFLDHCHFLKKKGKSATEDLDEIILKLQNLAKKLEVPVVAIAHLRKLNGDKPPELDDLRDSSSLSQVPSLVMLLYREKDPDMLNGYLSNEGTLFIPKNRIQGKTGGLKFYIKQGGKIEFKSTGIQKEVIIV